MPLYTGDKIGFGVAPAEEGGGAGEVGYSTSFDNRSHAADIRTEHKWVVPKTARYNFEVWGADGGMGLSGDTNMNGGVPRYGRGGKVEASLQLTAGTEIGIIIGDVGAPVFNTGGNSYLNTGQGGWGGSGVTGVSQSLADGGNSKYNYRAGGGGGSNYNYKGAGGGGGTIVRMFESSDTYLIVAGGGGGAGARGQDNNNSNNQGGAGGNANDKVNEGQYGRRGHYAGDTSYGWPSGNASHAGNGDSTQGGNGGNGYYSGGGGGGGGCGGGGGGATCQYCGSAGGSGGGCGSDGNHGSGYTAASGGGAGQHGGGASVVGCGGNIATHDNNNMGGGGGGGYRGGGAGYWGNGQGHAGGGGGGGGASWVIPSATYDPKGLNGINGTPRYTSEQKPLRLGNPGGGKVFIWEANKDPLGKDRPASLTADKIQYLVRSQNGGASNTQRLYYLGSGSTEDHGGCPDYDCYNNSGYSNSTSACDAVVMEIDGTGIWELHSVTVGQGNGYDYPMPYRHQCWVHVIEGSETGGVGIHTEKFDANNTTGSGTAGWYAHRKASSKNQNTENGYIELFFEKPAVLKRGEKYTIALDWSCGGTNSTQNPGGMQYMSSGATSARTLIGSQKGTCTWTSVTAFNGPHGLGSNNGTSSSQGQLVHFGVRSVYVGAPGETTLGQQGNPARNAKEIFDAGQRNNGLYWIKGDGSSASARQIYCIMDENWAGGGWMVIANHDAQKQPNSGHQPRPTAYPAYVGCDSGGQGTPNIGFIKPNESFSIEMTDIPFTKVMQFVYDSSDMSNISVHNWLSYDPHCYWSSSFNSEQKIPTDTAAWILVFDTRGIKESWNGSEVSKRHLYGSSSGDPDCEAFGCMNGSGQSPVSRNGNGGNQSDPVYIATWQHNSNTNNAETISWCDTSSSGYDDWQDGSGQGDNWFVEGTGSKGNAQGKPSMIVVQ